MAKLSNTYLAAVFNSKCPRCREGKIYESPNAYKYGQTLKMNEVCPVCKQPTETVSYTHLTLPTKRIV